jgi:hypothetical protein
MPVKLYIWYPKAFNSSGLSAFTFNDVGHVSMQIGNIYISHRPKLQNDNNNDISNLPTLENNNTRTYFIEYILQSLLSMEQRPIKTENISPLQRSNKDTTKKYVNIEPVPSADSRNFSYSKEARVKGRLADRTIEIYGLDEDRMLTYYETVRGSEYHAIKNNCSTLIANVIRSSLNCSQELCSFCLRKYEFKNFDIMEASIIGAIVATLTISTGGLSMPILYSSFGTSLLTRIPVWTPTLIEEFINLLEANSKKCLTKECSTLSVYSDDDTAMTIIRKLHGVELHHSSLIVQKLENSSLNLIDDVVDGVNDVINDAVKTVNVVRIMGKAFFDWF